MMRKIAGIVIFFACVTAHGQAMFFGLLGASSSNPCALPYTPTLSGTGPLPSCYTATIAGLPTVTQSGGYMVAASGYGIAAMTGVPAQSPASSLAKYLTASTNSGPGLFTTSGNGYAWLPSLGVVYIVTAGSGVSTLTNACPTVSVNDTLKISISGTTITCKDVTTSTTVTNTDSTYAGSTLYTGVVVYASAPLSNPSSTSP
jgi:hypothetical protein